MHPVKKHWCLAANLWQAGYPVHVVWCFSYVCVFGFGFQRHDLLAAFEQLGPGARSLSYLDGNLPSNLNWQAIHPHLVASLFQDSHDASPQDVTTFLSTQAFCATPVFGYFCDSPKKGYKVAKVNFEQETWKDKFPSLFLTHCATANKEEQHTLRFQCECWATQGVVL